MARGLAEAGADVVISSRHENELHTAAAEIRHGLDTGVATLVADMTKREEVKKLAETAIHAFGKIDILINNAGSNIPQPLETIEDKDWDQILELNLTSCMALSRYLVPPMKARRWGRIIYLSSIMGLSSYMGRSAYSATKSAVIGLCRASALELGEFGITVNCIAPGPILTDLPARVLTDEVRRAVAARTAIGRWGDPRELAGPAVFLASEAGNYVTGSIVVVDGGILARVF
jgi:NAD(P)-dependent dehydrogenase (short-subunit alcohol dehydrogenase family)